MLSFALFSYLGYLEGDTKNVTYFLLRMVIFIKQCLLEYRMTKDILQISEFGFITWEFLSAIYKSG